MCFEADNNVLVFFAVPRTNFTTTFGRPLEVLDILFIAEVVPLFHSFSGSGTFLIIILGRLWY